MTQRERLLSIAVGAMVVSVGGMWLYSKVNKAYSTRNATIRQLNEDIQRKELLIRGGRASQRQLDTLNEMSLPSNLEVARSQYQAWLSQLAVNAHWKDPQIKHLTQSKLASGATQITSTVSGECSLEQLTRFLYDFYRVPTLHRVSKLPIKPVVDSKDLRVSMTVESLVLPTAPRDVDFDATRVNEFGSQPFEQLAGPILQRNMFAPANRPPAFQRIDAQRVAVGESLRTTLAARDPDQLDKLEFAAGENIPERLEIDKQSGEVRWRPEAVGTYTFEAIVRDDGTPRLSDRVTITVNVEEQAKSNDKPAVAAADRPLDEARFTYPIASLDIEGRKQIWLQIRTKGEILRLSEGDPVKIGSIEGVITRIGQRDVLVTVGEDEHLIRLGSPLVGATIDPENGL